MPVVPQFRHLAIIPVVFLSNCGGVTREGDAFHFQSPGPALHLSMMGLGLLFLFPAWGIFRVYLAKHNTSGHRRSISHVFKTLRRFSMLFLLPVAFIAMGTGGLVNTKPSDYTLSPNGVVFLTNDGGENVEYSWRDLSAVIGYIDDPSFGLRFGKGDSAREIRVHGPNVGSDGMKLVRDWVRMAAESNHLLPKPMQMPPGL